MKSAKAGDKVTAKAVARLNKINPYVFPRLFSTEEGCTVAPKSDAQAGQWVCIDCGEAFGNNLGANMHTKSHRAAWWTGEVLEEP